MTPFLLDAALVLICSALFAAILYLFSRRRRSADSTGVHWRGLIGLALVGGLIVTIVFNLLEQWAESSPDQAGDPGEVLLTKPDTPD